MVKRTSTPFPEKTINNEHKLMMMKYCNKLLLVAKINDIDAKNDERLIAILVDALSSYQEIPFMTIDNEGSSEKINGKYSYTPDDFETKVRGILSGKVETQKIEHIKAFPFQGYHTEKKTYLRIYTHGTGKRKTATKAVQDNNYKTTSDNLYSFHRKYPVKAPKEGEEDLEVKEYMDGLIKIKINVEDDFTSSFLKLSGYILIDCGLDSKADMPYDKM
ncbi:607_t:CDS:2 [Funneliformis geosporum]|uniref:607_t:CDS:1 n=1 Tax=Funneliformis geosporum TaxID=1117311 RepID=A0A9W4WVF3_9GLOM|nr:607_t:CDS:2 [Funneliformis geosporum]